MKEKKKFSSLWLIPAVVIIALILWCIHFPLTMFMGLDEDAEIEVATLAVYPASGGGEIAFNTTDRQQLSEIVEQMQKVRCRFFGWSNIMNISAEKPTIDLVFTGYEGESPFGVHLSVNGRNEIHIWSNNLSLRAKDSGLYEYLRGLVSTAIAEQAENERAAGTSAIRYLERLERVRNQFENLDLTVGTVLTADGYDEEKAVMEYVVWKTEQIKDYHWDRGNYDEYPDTRTDYKMNFRVKEKDVADGRALLTIEENTSFQADGGPSAIYGIYTVELVQVGDTWLIASVECGDIYSLEEIELLQYREKMPELYEQARAEIFSFGGTLSAQVTNVIKAEKRILPAEDNFEYTVYTVLPGAELRVIKTNMVETTDQGLVGDWVLYDSSGDYTVINPYSLTNSIPITETTRGIGTESVCVLVFELYTGEE